MFETDNNYSSYEFWKFSFGVPFWKPLEIRKNRTWKWVKFL